MHAFTYTTFPQQVRFGTGALDTLGEIVAQQGWTRVLLITSRSQRTNGNVARIEELLGEKLTALFDATQPHVPQANVDAAVTLAQAHRAEALLALGGGSAIGVAKAASHALYTSITNQQSQITNLQSPISNHKSPIPILAIPTTYAGSEMTPVFGVTRERAGLTKKETTNDPRILPRLVLYDPLLTLGLGRDLTTSTGVNAFAHCVEAVYSITRNPLSTLAAIKGARLIFDALPRCYEDGRNVAARTDMLEGAYLAGTSLANVAMGLHHGICHILGGTAHVPHGIANAIILPHALRFNADACAQELAPLAAAVGIPRAADFEMALVLADRITDWIARLGLPARLRDMGVQESELTKLAELAFASKTVQNNPKKIPDAGTLEKLLYSAW